jgi:hypothetical protein
LELSPLVEKENLTMFNWPGNDYREPQHPRLSGARCSESAAGREAA